MSIVDADIQVEVYRECYSYSVKDNEYKWVYTGMLYKNGNFVYEIGFIYNRSIGPTTEMGDERNKKAENPVNMGTQT